MSDQKKESDKIVLVPLPEFQSDDLKKYANFDNSITIKKTSTNLLETLPINARERFLKIIGNHDMGIIRRCNFWLINNYKSKNQDFNSLIDSQEDLKVNLFLLCIWLIKPMEVTGDLRFKVADGGSTISFHRLIARMFLHPYDTDENFNNKDIRKLRKLWTKVLETYNPYQRVTDKNRRIFNALSKLQDGIMAYNLDSRFVFFTIALESLFSHERTEVTYRLSNRVAWFLGSSQNDRRAIFNEFKNIYNARSGFAHGLLPTKKLSTRDMHLLYSLEKFCREILLKIFDTPKLLNVFTSGKNNAEEYIKSLTLGAK